MTDVLRGRATAVPDDAPGPKVVGRRSACAASTLRPRPTARRGVARRRGPATRSIPSRTAQGGEARARIAVGDRPAAGTTRRPVRPTVMARARRARWAGVHPVRAAGDRPLDDRPEPGLRAGGPSRDRRVSRPTGWTEPVRRRVALPAGGPAIARPKVRIPRNHDVRGRPALDRSAHARRFGARTAHPTPGRDRPGRRRDRPTLEDVASPTVRDPPSIDRATLCVRGSTGGRPRRTGPSWAPAL
jgi:hypothetical protein